MAANSSDYFMKVGRATATTLSAPGYTIGNTTVNVASTTNWPTDTGVTFAIDEIDSSGERVAGSYNVFRGVVSGATQLTSVTYVGGDANRNYSAGATTRVYILVSAFRDNRFTDGVLVSHEQDGTLKSGLTIKNPTIADANGNEQIKFVTTTSAVNELTQTNSATGNAVTTETTGGDANISWNQKTKGTGEIQWNGVPASGAFQSWTPTYTAGSGTPTTVTTNKALYKQIGKQVTLELDITIANKGTATGHIEFTLPVAAKNALTAGHAIEVASTGNAGSCWVKTTAKGAVTIYTGSTGWVDNYRWLATIVYEAA